MRTHREPWVRRLRRGVGLAIVAFGLVVSALDLAEAWPAHTAAVALR